MRTAPERPTTQEPGVSRTETPRAPHPPGTTQAPETPESPRAPGAQGSPRTTLTTRTTRTRPAGTLELLGRALGELAGPHATTRRQLGLRWWRELLLIGIFYVAYGIVRNRFGSAAVGPGTAHTNAEIVIELERALGIYNEAAVQAWFLDWTVFISVWNVFYGLLHFTVTAFVLFWLYTRFPEAYRRWRTSGLICTGLGLVGFALFPLMPPRLLGDCGPYGACVRDSGFVDTMVHYEGLWSFDSGAFQKLSNQYAAMPSIHFAWAFWCFLALRGRIANPWGRTLVYLYPVLTLFAVVVTANHYWIDAVAGVVCVLLALAWATPFTRWIEQRRRGFRPTDEAHDEAHATAHDEAHATAHVEAPQPQPGDN